MKVVNILGTSESQHCADTAMRTNKVIRLGYKILESTEQQKTKERKGFTNKETV